jgi:acyl-coenzyme A synthetase/AMP-(fatty) acid ligase
MSASLAVPNVASWLENGAVKHPDRVAIVGLSGTTSYKSLLRRTNQCGNLFLSRGCRRGDRVVLVLPDGPDFVSCFMACAKIGAIAVPVNPLSHKNQVEYYLSNCSPTAIVHDKAMPAVHSLKAEGVTLNLDDEYVNQRVEEQSPELSTTAAGGADDLCILYTSGSTGEPKGAVHSHDDMFACAKCFGSGILGIQSADRTFSVSKLPFAYGLGNGMYFALSAGASTILNPAPTTLEAVKSLIEMLRPTLFFAVPTFYANLFRALDGGFSINLSSVRIAVSAGEVLSPGLVNRFTERFGIDILNGVGSTEMFQTFLSNRPKKVNASSCGAVVPGYEAKLVDENGAPIGIPKSGLVSQIGSLWVKGPSAFSRYWDNPKLTEETKDNCWVRTGDKYYTDPDGHYYFCGREDDMMKVSGMWVIPKEVERILLSCPGVTQAFVTTNVDELGIRSVVAYIGTADEIKNDELRRFVAGILPDQMVPTTIRVLRELPLTANGKVDRVGLAMLSEGAQYDKPSSVVETLTETQQRIMLIWQELLKTDQIGLNDDFMDAGGNSMLATQLLNRLREEFDVDLPIGIFFIGAVGIKELSEVIEHLRGQAEAEV